MSIWIDIHDLIQYYDTGCRPSGIQRLSFELTCALVEAGGDDVRVCRHAPGPHGFIELDWPSCKARLETLTRRRPVCAPPVSGSHPVAPSAPEISRLRRLVRRLPDDIRVPLAALYVTERDAARALGRAVLAQRQAARICGGLAAKAWRRLRPSRASRRGPLRPVTTRGPAVARGPARECPAVFARGDVLLAIGATWQFAAYGGRIDRLRAEGVRFAPFVHDMVPLLFPEWSVRSTTESFTRWVETVLTRADLLFTNSVATQRDVAAVARLHDLPIPRAVPVPIGATFSARAAEDAPPLHPRPYVLFVSTIEPRKNHAGMLRLWREMIAGEPPELVPDLVLAGRVGWLADDVIAQAENASWFGGKLRLIESPSDEDLACLYRDCLFTIYPSFYEGWGLPVTESLGFGKPVAASNRASIPEAGGRFCVYFDPDDLGDVRRVIGSLIRDPVRRATLESDIATSYRPPSWRDGATTILAALAGSGPASAPARSAAPERARSAAPATLMAFSARALSSRTG